MLRALVRSCVFAGCVVSIPIEMSAQEVVHALTGTVSAINKNSRTVDVFVDGGSQREFPEMTNPKTRLDFDRKIEAQTTAVDAFSNNGAYAIVFYYGVIDHPTAVAFKNLGAGPFKSTVGTVTRFERSHSISVKDKSGAVLPFKIDPETVAESYFGAEDGSRFEAQNGDHVRVVSSTEHGSPTALFISVM
jgi:hypothetical protein